MSRAGGGVPDVPGRIVLRLNQRSSVAVGVLAAALARLDGATCARVDGLVVCSGARGRSFARGGTTFGDCYVTGSDPATRTPARLRHERVHQQQWHRWGLLFPVLYLCAELAARGRPSRNRFEVAAGLADGGYA